MLSFQDFFGDWENDDSKNQLVPILNFGHNGQGEHFLIVIETGEIISTYLEDFILDCDAYGHNCEYNPKQFLLDVTKDYYIIKLSNVLDLQNLLIDCEDFEDITEKHSYQEMQKMITNCLGWTLKELDKRTSHFGMSFAYFLLEERLT
ncbi:MAG: hypothetical protein GY827_03725 [Cytophagales bacterium]|nr:hypothetical protein [Cytophagales bacterium]